VSIQDEAKVVAAARAFNNTALDALSFRLPNLSRHPNRIFVSLAEGLVKR